MRILLALVLALGLAGKAAAFTDTDRNAVQQVIEGQLQAFLHDDGATAYSFAAPAIQMMYPTAEAFMAMVAKAYPPVYRPRSHQFGDLTEDSGALEQSVDIVDSDGEFWTAVYTLRQGTDGAWKITGCFLMKKPGKVA